MIREKRLEREKTYVSGSIDGRIHLETHDCFRCTDFLGKSVSAVI